MMELCQITFSGGGGDFLDLSHSEIPGRKNPWNNTPGDRSSAPNETRAKSLGRPVFPFKKVSKMVIDTVSDTVKQVIEGEQPRIHMLALSDGRRMITLCNSFERDLTYSVERLFGVSGLDYERNSLDSNLPFTGTATWEVGSDEFEVTAVAEKFGRVMLQIDWVYTDNDSRRLTDVVRKLSRVFTAMKMKLEAPLP